MRSRSVPGLFLYLTAAALTGVGCSGRPSAPAGFPHLAGRNLTQEPIRWVDDCAFKKAAEAEAEAAWAAVGPKVPPQPFLHDYRCGFIEGYVDYLDAGGNGEPPLAPPFRYRLNHHKNPEGAEKIDAWFAGFRHGSAAARASGQREAILVPLSGPVAFPDHGPPPPPPRELPPPKDGLLPPPREEPEKKDDKAAVRPTRLKTLTIEDGTVRHQGGTP